MIDSLLDEDSVEPSNSAEKEVVLKAAGKAFNDAFREETTFVDDDKVVSMDSWVLSDRSIETIESKETFEGELKDYSRRVETFGYTGRSGQNVVTTWVHSIPSEPNLDIYTREVLDGYTMNSHFIYNPDPDIVGFVFSYPKTNVHLSIDYLNGTSFSVDNGWFIRNLDAVMGNKSISIDYPFTLTMDSNGDGILETYTGTFVASDIDWEVADFYVSATILDSNGTDYGRVNVYEDGRVQLFMED